MNPRFYTIGMAGHIDHGKTTLTKALTNINTDRLKEEIERQISIELGYAPFPLGEYETSIVDVPGHEKFIRQMIAGVAGIDLVILVIAADEGMMPQTKEHLEILSFLGIEHGVIAVTKCDRVEPDFIELIMEDIQSGVKDTVFEQADIVCVDSVTGTGLEQLKLAIMQNLSGIKQRDAKGEFRLPIDQVFTLRGQGSIVRGTIYEGTVHKGDTLTLLPHNIPVKVRQMQMHNKEKESAIAGQRVAINLGGMPKETIKRGHVLVASDHFTLTRTIDVSLQSVKDLQHPVKQRTSVKFHSGTVEVMGKIVLFDRKEVNGDEQVLCQIRLNEPVAVKRGDRFVLRRPSPVETIGGGWIIDPFGEKYRFGEETVRKLERKREGSPEDRLLDILSKNRMLSKASLLQTASFDAVTLEMMLSSLLADGRVIALEGDAYTTSGVYDQVRSELQTQLEQYHFSYPMRFGMNKAECVQGQQGTPALLVETVINREVESGACKRDKQFISLASFEPHFPPEWSQPLETALARLEADELGVQSLDDYIAEVKAPKQVTPEIKRFLLQTKVIIPLDEKHCIHHRTFNNQLYRLYQGTNGQPFSFQDAKAVLNATRKGLVPFLELLDQLRYTQRSEEQRKWLKPVEQQS
ncbi:selenocysteine-specific translation elongation factor [Paenibacillus thalictri]|uniref:Selenocysteine-specific elongation factor n=1 Tax=Paenibacillus thalictri TaxID=2527873 RepID=A0A4Q9DQ13_9BACL|nr:selenocysteine-specific translation elongation factor [Paenibacillus thalictri]TBL76331.1 selenocysteine-specific translation elongation factor [Paenibacillus thalictri]